MITKHLCIADHDLISILYHTEIIVDKPQFRMTRNWSGLSRENLVHMIENDPIINSIFSLTSVDKVWNILLTQLNSYINKLAPTKVIQLKKNYVPYMTSEIKDHIEQSNQALSEAIRKNEPEEWMLAN